MFFFEKIHPQNFNIAPEKWWFPFWDCLFSGGEMFKKRSRVYMVSRNHPTQQPSPTPFRSGLRDVEWGHLRGFLLGMKFNLPCQVAIGNIQYETTCLGGGFNFFLFHPENWGRWTHFDDHIFQRGWFNHQLVTVCTVLLSQVINWSFLWLDCCTIPTESLKQLAICKKINRVMNIPLKLFWSSTCFLSFRLKTITYITPSPQKFTCCFYEIYEDDIEIISPLWLL